MKLPEVWKEEREKDTSKNNGGTMIVQRYADGDDLKTVL
jgi:hypothetical protein